MKITVLGSGHSGGTPMIGEPWETTDLKNPKNLRLRPAILVEDHNTRILVDTPPDLRSQLIAAQVEHLDAVIYTHGHADHLHGIDDLRAVNRVIKDWLPAYADSTTWDDIATRFGYVLEPLNNDTNFIYKPCLVRHDITVGETFTIGDLISVSWIRITAFRAHLDFVLIISLIQQMWWKCLRRVLLHLKASILGSLAPCGIGNHT